MLNLLFVLTSIIFYAKDNTKSILLSFPFFCFISKSCTKVSEVLGTYIQISYTAAAINVSKPYLAFSGKNEFLFNFKFDGE